MLSLVSWSWPEIESTWIHVLKYKDISLTEYVKTWQSSLKVLFISKFLNFTERVEKQEVMPVKKNKCRVEGKHAEAIFLMDCGPETKKNLCSLTSTNCFACSSNTHNITVFYDSIPKCLLFYHQLIDSYLRDFHDAVLGFHCMKLFSWKLLLFG